MINKIYELMKQYETKKNHVININQGIWLKLQTEEFILNNNMTIKRDVIVKPNRDAVIIIPKTTDDKFLMVIQPRPSTEKGATIEFPAGYIEEGEDFKTGAKRELIEETGYECKNIEIIKTYYQDIACSRAKITLLIAEDCKRVTTQLLDKDEMITYIELTYDELMELFNANMIVDANSILGIYYLNSK